MKDRYLINELSIEITKYCDLNCKMCSTEAGDKEKIKLEFKTLEKILNQAQRLKVKTISLSGGEPFSYPNFLKLCKTIKEKKFELLIYTCGNIKNSNGDIKPIPEDYFKQLKRIAVDKIIFNIQDADSKVHDYITEVEDSHKNGLTSLKSSIKYKIFSEVHYIPMKLNFNNIKKLYFLLKSFNINEISLLRFVPHGRGENNRSELELDLKQIQLLSKDLRDILNSKNGLKIRIGEPLRTILFNSPVNCTAGIDKLLIKPDGKVFPCVAMKNILSGIKNDCNDIKKYNLSEIWKKSKVFRSLREFKKNIASKNLFNENNKSFCIGCPAQKLIYIIKNQKSNETYKNYYRFLKNINYFQDPLYTLTKT